MIAADRQYNAFWNDIVQVVPRRHVKSQYIVNLNSIFQLEPRLSHDSLDGPIGFLKSELTDLPPACWSGNHVLRSCNTWQTLEDQRRGIVPQENNSTSMLKSFTSLSSILFGLRFSRHALRGWAVEVVDLEQYDVSSHQNGYTAYTNGIKDTPFLRVTNPCVTGPHLQVTVGTKLY